MRSTKSAGFQVGDKQDERKEPNFSSACPTGKWLPNGRPQPGAVGRRSERPRRGRFHILEGVSKVVEPHHFMNGDKE